MRRQIVVARRVTVRDLESSQEFRNFVQHAATIVLLAGLFVVVMANG